MEPTVLYSTLYGSHLYGTNTPTSDLDIKRIVLPPLGDLLLCKRVENKVKKTNTAKNTKNGVDDVDQEDIPLQVFIRDFVDGQTYALELAFSVDGSHAQQQVYPVPNGHEWNENRDPDPPCYMFSQLVRELKAKFLTSNVKAMMGYVFNQANIYSFKSERLNCARAFRDLLMKGWTDPEAGDDPLTDFVGETKPLEMAGGGYWTGAPPQQEGSKPAEPIVFALEFAKLAQQYPKYFRVDQYDIGGGRMRPCFIVLEKTFPWTNTLSHSVNVADTLIAKYGNRADAASVDNVDWKAMMHAVRIIDEGLELLETKVITLPRPDPGRLLQIKRGELPLEPLKEELVEKLDRLKDVSAACGLPISSDPQFKAGLERFTLRWLRLFYSL